MYTKNKAVLCLLIHVHNDFWLILYSFSSSSTTSSSSSYYYYYYYCFVRLLRKFRGNWCSAVFWRLLFSYLLVLPSVFNNHNCSLTISFSARFIVKNRSFSGKKLSSIRAPHASVPNQISRKTVHWETSCSMRTDVHRHSESTYSSRFWQIFPKLTLYTFRQTEMLLVN